MRRPGERLSLPRGARNVAAAFVAAALAACGGSGGAAGASALEHVTSDSGAYAIDVGTDAGDAPVRGVNTLVFTIHDAQTGAPATGLALTIVPFMPAMGHGASVTPTVAESGGGKYVASDVDLFMPGTWELRTSIASPSGATDHADPRFQIE